MFLSLNIQCLIIIASAKLDMCPFTPIRFNLKFTIYFRWHQYMEVSITLSVEGMIANVTASFIAILVTNHCV